MTIVGKDRRGLAEIVAISGMTVAVAIVLVAQIATGHEPDKALMGALVGLVLLMGGRGVQSAMERGASSEQRNFESSELRQAAELLRREAEELRRANEINRVLQLTTQQKDKG